MNKKSGIIGALILSLAIASSAFAVTGGTTNTGMAKNAVKTTKMEQKKHRKNRKHNKQKKHHKNKKHKAAPKATGMKKATK